MNTKARVLAILEENRGTVVSGQALAQAAGVSRTAVWKPAHIAVSHHAARAFYDAKLPHDA